MGVKQEELARVKEIYVIPYSHHDYAWTNSREWHIRRYLQSFNELLDVMKDNGQFTWLIDNVAHSFLPYIEHCPEKIAEMKARAAEGRIYVANGGYSLARSTHIGEETFIRNMVAGKRFFQSFFAGGNPIDLFLSADVACGHSQMPQLLQLAGHRYYRFMRPETALDAKKIPRQFVWQGLDGSRIVVSRGTYGGFAFDAKYTFNDFDRQWEETRQAFIDQELTDKVDELLMADIVWLNYGGDDVRPLHNLFDEPINIVGFVEEWNKREQVKLFFSHPGAYFERLQTASLPVHQGVLDPCELSYNAAFRGSYSMWRMRSELDRLIVKVESLATMAAFMGKTYPHGQLEALWFQLFDITGHAIEAVFRSNYEELYAIAEGARSSARTLIRQTSAFIAAALQSERESQYVVINTLGWSRQENVQLHITSAFGISGFDLYDSFGNPIDYQIVNVYSGDKRYVNCEVNEVDIVTRLDIPSMGFAGVSIVRNGTSIAEKIKAEFRDDESRAATGDVVVINNDQVEAAFDSGRIGEIKLHHETGWVQTADLCKGLKFVRTRPSHTWVSSWETVEELGLEPIKWELVENGPLRWVYRVYGIIGSSRARLDYILNKGERAIGFDLELDSDRQEGYYAVAFASDPDTRLHADIPFGVEERNLAAEPYGEIPGSLFDYNPYERGQAGQFYGKSWALFQSAGLPVAIVSGNGSIYYHHDREQQEVSLLLHRCMPLDHKHERWLKETHPSIDGSGKHHYHYYLYFPERSGQTAGISRFAKGKAQPVETTVKYNTVAAEFAVNFRAFVETANDNVIVTAFYLDHGSCLLRFYEGEGRSTLVRFTFAFDFKRVSAVDLLGNTTDQPPVEADATLRSLSVEVQPWQIVTLKLEY